MNTIEEYIQETPFKMAEMLEKSEQLFNEIIEYDFEKIIFTGSGTSYHSALQSKNYIQDLLNVNVEVLYPFMITDSLFNNNSESTLVIGISQGGSSYSTYNAMKISKKNGCKIASMAGVENALIDEFADFILTVYCGPEEAGAKTKGYNTTKFHIMLLSLFIAKEKQLISLNEYENRIMNIEQAIKTFDENYRISKIWVDEIKNDLSKSEDIRVIGTADLYGDALEGALKLLETFRVPVTGYEFEEFIHGIYNAINEDSTLIIFDSGQEERLDKLIEVLGGWTNSIYVITNQNKESNRNLLRLDISNENEFGKLQFILPIQLMCAKVPEIKKINPSIPKDPNFHKKLESKKM